MSGTIALLCIEDDGRTIIFNPQKCTVLFSICQFKSAIPGTGCHPSWLAVYVAALWQTSSAPEDTSHALTPRIDVCSFFPDYSSAFPDPATFTRALLAPFLPLPATTPTTHPPTHLPSQLARKAGSWVAVALQMFVAPSKVDGDRCRKPSAGLWDFMLQHCNDGIAPGVCMRVCF